MSVIKRFSFRFSNGMRSRVVRASIVCLVLLALLVMACIHLMQRTSAKGSIASGRPRIESASLSEDVSIHAAGRGNPYINLADGRDIITAYSGADNLVEALETNQAQALSLASADFDEDGVPDLVSGYAAPSGGIITLMRGNLDSIYPNAPEAKQRKAEGTSTEAPFLSPAFAFFVPEAVDFVGAGDFDGDSHWDVVAARKGGDRLYLLSGDGRGKLSGAKRIELPGRVTAMAVGEINRADGLDDVVIGIATESEANVMVFEGPEGALRAKPEIFDMPDEVSSLALGELDGEYTYDLAVAAGKSLTIIHGRDRKLSLDEARQSAVASARVEQRAFINKIASIAVGDFSGSHADEIAAIAVDGSLTVLSRGDIDQQLKSNGKNIRIQGWDSQTVAIRSGSATAKLVVARVSSIPVDNLLVTDSASQDVDVIVNRARDLKAESASEGEALEDVLKAQLRVSEGTEAILPMRLNADALSDLVVMKRGVAVPTIVPTAVAQVYRVTTTEDNGNDSNPTPGSLRRAIINANANPGMDEIRFEIPGSGVPSIRLNRTLPTITEGVTIDGSTQPGGKVELDATRATNIAALFVIVNGNTTLRGLVINRSGFTAIRIFTNGNNIIEGNYLGTDIAGRISLPNGKHPDGVIEGDIGITSPNNVVGGTTVQARNVISCGKFGVYLYPDANRNQVKGNYIGTGATGTEKLGNPEGIGVLMGYGASANIIGGTEAGARNVISGTKTGVSLQNFGTDGNMVQGNFIGTDPSGNFAVGNNCVGVAFIEGGAANNLVGGTVASARNVISGNNCSGVYIQNNGGRNNQIQGNFIGTNVAGTAAIPNNFDGVQIEFALDNTVGGAVAGAGNVISGNGGNGVRLGVVLDGLQGGQGSTVIGNYIGTDVTGTAPLGNAECGVFIQTNAVRHRIENNRIAFNGSDGVCLAPQPSNTDAPPLQILIFSNDIWANQGIGIDLGNDGATPNDGVGDADLGANELQNFPEILSVTRGGAALNSPASLAAGIQVTYKLESKPNSEYRVQFWFAAICCNTGSSGNSLCSYPRFLGTKTVRTGPDGSYSETISFDFTPPSAGGFVNATATDSRNNTSEYSSCIPVEGSVQGPTITGVRKSGKKLIVTGTGFVAGAQLLLNDARQKKVTVNSSSEVVGKKAGNNVVQGKNKVRIENPDGTSSNEYEYSFTP